MFSKTLSRPLLSASKATSNQLRNLSIHEYRSANLLKSYGIAVPNGGAAVTPEDAYKIAKELNTEDMVIKAQALTGGRGKGHFDNGLQSGVRLVSTPEEVKDLAEKMLHHKLITKQTGAAEKTNQPLLLLHLKVVWILKVLLRPTHLLSTLITLILKKVSLMN
ncbi:unnamed protein product [[Candida] boidinii]|nr:unnamed protein product [[Candida] boidinii]